MKKTLFAALFLLFSITVFSQFFIETEIGYAIPSNKTKFYNADIISVDNRIENVYDAEIIPIKFSIIQSPFLNISCGYKVNKWEVALGFSYGDNKSIKGFNRNNSYLIDRSIIWGNDGDDRIFNIRIIENHSYYTKGYYLFPGISYLFAIKHITIQPLLGVSFRSLSIYETYTRESTTFVLDSPEEESPNYVTQRYNYKSSFSNNFSNMFAIWSGLQISYNLNNNLDLSCKIKCSLGNYYRVTERTQTSYEKEFMGNIQEFDDNEYIYVTDKLFDTNTLNFSIGIRYTFYQSNNKAKDEL